MQVVINEKDELTRELEITVDQKVVDAAYDKAFEKERGQLALPGFRKGKVPNKMAKKYIPDGYLTQGVLEKLYPKTVSTVLDEYNLVPLTEADINIIDIERGKDFKFTIAFEVKPEVTIKDYKGIPIEQERIEVTDTLVEEAIDNMLSQKAHYEPSEEKRKIVDGDTIVVDYTTKALDGNDPDAGEAKDFQMEVSADKFIPGFTDNIVGMDIGETKSFTITFPENYGNQALANREVEFTFTVNQLMKKEQPELTDELVQELTPYKTIDELKDALRNNMNENAEKQAAEGVQAKIIEKLLEQVDEDVITEPYKKYLSRYQTQSMVRQMQQYGMNFEHFLAQTGMSPEQFLAQIDEQALIQGRVDLVIDSVAKQEDIKVTPEEVEQVLRMEALRNRGNYKKLHKALKNNGELDFLKQSLLKDKVTGFLIEEADITYYVDSESDAEAKPKAKKATKKKASSSKKDTASKAADKRKSTTKESKPKATKESKPKATKKKKADAKDEGSKKKTTKSKTTATKTKSKKAKKED